MFTFSFDLPRFANGGYAIALVSRQETHLKPVQQELEQQGHTGIHFFSPESSSIFDTESTILFSY